MPSSISFDFTVSEASKVIPTDTFINIIRRREEIIFKQTTDNENVNISYFSTDSLNTLNSLYIADRSSSLLANRVEVDSDSVILDNVSSYTIETDKFLLTDVFTDPDNTVGVVPIYFQHVIDTNKVLRTSDTDLTFPPTTKLVSVQILDANFQPINVAEVKLDTTKGILYNNLVSSYDPSTGDFVVYYVKYSVKINNTVLDYVDLLSNTNVYRVATIEDLDDFLNIINDGRKVYLIEAVDNNFNVTLPTGNDYAFKITSAAKLKIIPPPPLDTNSPWRVKVSNTQFYTTLGGDVLKYRVAEFNNQGWNPSQPYKRSIAEESDILAQNLIKTNYGRIHTDPVNSLYVDVLVNDSSGIGITAFTTDPGKIAVISPNGTRYIYWTTLNREGIKSIDAKGGFIEIEGFRLKSVYEVISTYYYEEDQYEFSILDFNPINNPDVLTTKASLFVDPDTLLTNKTQTLYYLVSDKAGKVIDSNWPDYDQGTGKLDNGKTLYYEKIPSFVSDPNTALFVSQYTTEGSGVLLVLGDVQVTEQSAPEVSTVIDTRTRGGGLIETLVDGLKLKNPEANWYWDLGSWDGTPYPGNASYLVEIPVEVMEGAGGVLLSNQIKDTVARHTAAGVYPIVKAYGIDPTVSGVNITGDSITIKWGSYGY